MLLRDLPPSTKNDLLQLKDAKFLQLFIVGGHFLYSNILQIEGRGVVLLLFQKEQRYLQVKMDFNHTPLYQLHLYEDFSLSLYISNDYPYEAIKPYTTTISLDYYEGLGKSSSAVETINFIYSEMRRNDKSFKYLSGFVILLKSKRKIRIEEDDQPGSFAIQMSNQ